MRSFLLYRMIFPVKKVTMRLHNHFSCHIRYMGLIISFIRKKNYWLEAATNASSVFNAAPLSISSAASLIPSARDGAFSPM
jgi:hypothetical protein